MERLFRHAVGRSTFKEGLAVPKSAESWVGAPQSGQKRTVVLLFDGQQVPATVRRLGNDRQHVQVKYEGRTGEPFRNWLISRFGTSPGRANGDYLELALAGDGVFQVTACPAQVALFPVLSVRDWLFHRDAERLLEQDSALSEIPAVVRTIPFDLDQSQAHYNLAFSASFRDWDWQPEGRVIPELGLKYDFAKDGVQVEVEFGNARTYYQDYIKFLLAHQRKAARVGVLLVPSSSFAQHPCDVGRRKAVERGGSSYSGMVHFDKVKREFAHLEFLLSMPIAIAGVGPS